MLGSEDAVGLTGSLFTDLLHLLLKLGYSLVAMCVFFYLTKLFNRPVPPVYAERLASRLQCRSHELVSYAIFSTGVKACLILRGFTDGVNYCRWQRQAFDLDFLRKAKSLFNLLDVSNCGK